MKQSVIRDHSDNLADDYSHGRNVLRRCLLVCLIIVVVTLTAAAQEQAIVVVTPKPPTSHDARFLSLIYGEAFNRLGIDFSFQTYPAGRASILSDTGEVDGELSRIYSYSDKHSALLRVEEPHWRTGFLVFSSDENISVRGWEDLQNRPYRVVFQKGIFGSSRALSQVVEPERLLAVTRIEQGFKMVLAGRADMMVASEMGGMSFLVSDQFKPSGLRVVGVMNRFTSHMFLHRKHRDLIPALSEVLRQMKHEGLLDRYAEEVNLPRFFNCDNAFEGLNTQLEAQ